MKKQRNRHRGVERASSKRAMRASGPENARGMVVQVILGLVALLGAGYVVWDWRTGSGRKATDGDSVAASSIDMRLLGKDADFREPPAARREQIDQGQEVARVDIEALSAWCRSYNLPDPPNLSVTEPAIADALLERLRSVVRHPNAESFGQMGMFCESLDCHESAERYFGQAERLDGKDHRWPYYLGCIYQITGRTEPAVAGFERALRLNPDYHMTHGRLGQLFLENGEDARAEEHIRRYVGLRPNDSLGFVGLARLALKRKDYSEAARQASEGLRRVSSDFQTHYCLAQAYMGLGQRELAKEHFNACAKLPKGMWFATRDPLDQAMHATTASAASLVKELEQKKNSQDWPYLAGLAEEIIKRRPDDVVMMCNLGGFYRKMGRYGDAHAVLDRAGKLDVRVFMVPLTRSEVLLAEGRQSEALAAADAAISLDGRAARAHSIRGRALLLMGRYEEAISSLRRCLEIGPENASDVFVIAEALHSAGRGEEASAYYSRVLELSPNQADAKRRLAEYGQTTAPAKQ